LTNGKKKINSSNVEPLRRKNYQRDR